MTATTNRNTKRDGDGPVVVRERHPDLEVLPLRNGQPSKVGASVGGFAIPAPPKGSAS